MKKERANPRVCPVFFVFDGPGVERSVSFDIFTDFCQVLLDTVRIFIPDILQED